MAAGAAVGELELRAAIGFNGRAGRGAAEGAWGTTGAAGRGMGHGGGAGVGYGGTVGAAVGHGLPADRLRGGGRHGGQPWGSRGSRLGLWWVLWGGPGAAGERGPSCPPRRLLVLPVPAILRDRCKVKSRKSLTEQ